MKYWLISLGGSLNFRFLHFGSHVCWLNTYCLCVAQTLIFTIEPLCLISIDPCNDAMNGCHYLSNYICVYHVLPSTVIIHKMLKITMVRFSTLSHVYDLYGRWFSNLPSESPSLTFFTIPGLLNENGENPSDIPCYCKCRQVWDCHAITHQIDHLSHHLFVGKKTDRGRKLWNPTQIVENIHVLSLRVKKNEIV